MSFTTELCELTIRILSNILYAAINIVDCGFNKNGLMLL
jgi:hypothetical protein